MPKLQADNRHDGDQRVMQRVAPDDDAFGLSLGAHRADVVGADDLEHRGAGHTRHHGDSLCRQRKRG